MKKAEVEVGGIYLAKVSGVLTLVRIDGETRSYGRTARTWWKATKCCTQCTK